MLHVYVNSVVLVTGTMDELRIPVYHETINMSAYSYVLKYTNSMLRMKDFRVSGDRNTMVVLIIEVTHRTDFTLPKQETAARHEDNLFNPKSQTHKTSLSKKSCNYHVKKHSFEGT